MKLTKATKAKAYDNALSAYYRYTKIFDIDLAAAKIADETCFCLGLHYKLSSEDYSHLLACIKTRIKQHHFMVNG